MSFLSFLNYGNHSHRVILDIGSGSVGGALVSQSANGHPNIEYSIRMTLPIKERVQSRLLASNTVQAVEKIAKKIREHTKHRISHIDAVFASPWYSANTKSVKNEGKDAFTITKKVIKDITDAEIESIKRSVPEESMVIEEKISNFMLNGYKCDSPFLKKAKSLELSFFVSFIPKEFALEIKSAIEHTAYPKSIDCHSFPMVASNAIKRIWHDDNFLLVDVGGEVTDTIFVKDGSISDTFSFPLGTNNLVRAISKKENIPHELSLSMLSLNSRGSTDPETAKNLASTLASLKEEWIAYMDQVLEDGGASHGSAQKVYIAADENVIPLWSEAINSRASNVVMLSEETFSAFVSSNPNVAPDPFLALESLYVNSN